jgi:hypothetical protein
MSLKFMAGWDQAGASEGLTGLNRENIIVTLFQDAAKARFKMDEKSEAVIAQAMGDTVDVWVTKGFHQNTQVSRNPLDKDRCANLHFNVSVGIGGRIRHAYVTNTNNGYRIREITTPPGEK